MSLNKGRGAFFIQKAKNGLRIGLCGAVRGCTAPALVGYSREVA